MISLKVEVTAIVGAILGVISLFLPWWAMDVMVEELPRKWMFYLYQTTLTFYFATPQVNTVEAEWYGLVAFGFILAGAALEVVGSIHRFRKVLYGGLILVASGVVFFTSGLVFHGYSPFFSSSGGTTYSEYLTCGYWLAVASFVIPVLGRLFARSKLPQPSLNIFELLRP